MKTEKLSFITTDKLTLVGIWHYPEQKSDKVIILCHGITVDNITF